METLRAILLTLGVAASLSAPACGAPPKPANSATSKPPKDGRFVRDANTAFLLEPDTKQQALVDRTGQIQPESSGSIVRDERFNWAWKLNAGGIVIKDTGSLRFDGGLTLDTWLRFDEPLPEKGALFALKVGSFDWDFQNGKVNTAWMVFPSEPIVGVTPPQYNYYPVGGDMINGLMSVPLGRWVRLTACYDEALGVTTTLIDGLVDRRRFRYRGPQRLQSDGKKPLTMLQGIPGCQVASVKLSAGPPDVLPPTMETYLQVLPFRGQVMLTLDHIDPRLPLPIEVVVVTEKASGEATTLQTIRLDSHARRDVLFAAATSWFNTLHTYSVSAAAGGRQFYSRSVRLANVKPAGRVTFDGAIASRDGKKFFPLMIYHAMPEDFPLMVELGFNLVLNDFNLFRAHGGDRAGYARELVECLDAAQKNNLGMIVSANAAFGKLHTVAAAKDHPALALWYGADEPWGDLARLQESYNTIKLLAPDPPVLVVQNNYSRLQDTAPGADILAVDPYPVPNVSLRAVADATQSARRAVADYKPVWTVIPQYGGKVPTRIELRCMAWLAIASGAGGLGVFTWDERSRDPQTRALRGWFTKEHPENIEDLRAVIGELRAGESVLVAPPAARQPSFAAANPAVHVLLKEPPGKRWLIAANDSRTAEEATLTIDGAKPTSAKRIDRGGDASAVRIAGGKLTVSLPAHGAGVFELLP